MNILTGDDIAFARKQQRLTQKELAEKAGVSQPMIARVENDTVDPTIETLHNIARVLADNSAQVPLDVSISSTLPEEIRHQRLTVGLTQAELANQVNISQPMVARIETGDVNPRASVTRAIVNELLCDDGYQSTGPVSAPDGETITEHHGMADSDNNTVEGDNQILQAIMTEFENLSGKESRSEPG